MTVVEPDWVYLGIQIADKYIFKLAAHRGVAHSLFCTFTTTKARGDLVLNKSSLSYYLYNEVSARESPILIDPALQKISWSK